MPRSIQLVGACLLLAACAQTSQPPMVTAPSASATSAVPAAAPPPPATPEPSAGPAPSASAAAAVTAGATPAPAPSSTVPAQYRACNTDADCVAVPWAGCCPHGWKEAIAAPQKDAYARDFACPQTRRPICPMYIVRDARVAKCDAREHLCEMVQP
jgi:hypothetical protein